MDALLPAQPDGAVFPGNRHRRSPWMTAAAATLGFTVVAFLVSADSYHGITDWLAAASPLPSAPSLSGSPLPAASTSAPDVAAPRYRERAARLSADAETPVPTRPSAAPPPPPSPPSAAADATAAIDAAAAAAPLHPPYPLLGAVRKVVSDASSPPAFQGHGELVSDPGVRCAVSDTYRFIYIVVQKAGSSSVRDYLVRSLCGSPRLGRKLDSNCTAPLLDYRDTGYRFTPCAEVPRAKFATYYVFSLIRNVWARAVSVYSFCKMGSTGHISWDAWCADPDTTRYCYRPAGPSAAWAVENGGPYPISRGTNEHWGAQLPRLCTSSGECWVDFVGRSEDIEIHLNEAIDAINDRREGGLPSLPPYVNAVKNARQGAAPPAAWYLPRSALSAADAAAADASGVTAEPSCRDAIARYYAADVAAFGSSFAAMQDWGSVEGGEGNKA